MTLAQPLPIESLSAFPKPRAKHNLATLEVASKLTETYKRRAKLPKATTAQTHYDNQYVQHARRSRLT